MQDYMKQLNLMLVIEKATLNDVNATPVIPAGFVCIHGLQSTVLSF